MKTKKKVIALTAGDPGGIGPEIILKSFEKPRLRRHLTSKKSNVFFVCIGSYDVLLKNKKILKSKIPLHCIKEFPKNGKPLQKGLNVLDVSEGKNGFSIGKVSKRNGKLAIDSIKTAGKLAKAKKIQAIVTAPVNKKACSLAFPKFKGHTEFLAKIDGTKKYAMMLSGGKLRVILATIHEPLKKVAKQLTEKGILEKIELGNDFLKRKLNRKPRIGVSGLNPHAGEEGFFGKEEKSIIRPALRKALRKKINVEGPLAGDTIFHKAYSGDLDLVISMYHDQGLAPLKMVAFDEGINTTLGLSFVRTSPDHGTAFDIAYQKKGNSKSMESAILAAIDLVGK